MRIAYTFSYCSVSDKGDEVIGVNFTSLRKMFDDFHVKTGVPEEVPPKNNVGHKLNLFVQIQQKFARNFPSYTNEKLMMRPYVGNGKIWLTLIIRMFRES